MAHIHNKKGTYFLRSFLVLSLMIFISFLIIGISLATIVFTYFRSETLDSLSENAKRLSSMTLEITSSDTAERNPEGAAMTLYKTIEIMSNCTGSDTFICSKDGSVIACKDIMSRSFELTKDVSCPYHGSIKITDDYITKVKLGAFTEFSTLGSVYASTHAIAMEPITSGGQFYGFVVITSPISGDITRYMFKFFSMFLIASAVTLLVASVILYFITDRMTKPIRQLAEATRCYAAGDFSIRVPELRSNDELSELVTEFNSMAVSLSELENSRRSFVANVSHEFKTPMTTIGGFIDGILDGTIPPEKQNYYLEIVLSEVKRLSRMVNMMLNISKIETGNIDLKIEQYDISQKLVTTFLGFEQLITKKSIDVSGLEDLVPLKIHGDAAMLDQAVYNLVDNAVKFTDNGGRILINVESDSKYAYFSVTNSGKGIPPEDIGKIFERFYKVDKSRSTDVKSTGLGLYLIKSIVELHGGTITAESDVDNFTRFTVKLPK